MSASASASAVRATPVPEIRSARATSSLPLAGVMVAALLLRLSGLGARSIWTDEGSTWTAASSPIGELIRLCSEKDASPPLFYLLTSLALRLFGDGEAWLRSVSVLASLGMVYLTYRFARLAAGRSESTLAATFVAISPHQLMFAQEARTYMLVAFFTTWSLYLFVRAVLFERRRAWLPLILVTAAGLWTQSIVVLGLGVQAAMVVLTVAGRRNAWRWALAMAAAFTLYAPWLAISAAQASRLGHSHWYLRTPGGHEVFQVLRAVFLSPIPLVTPPPTSDIPGIEKYLPRILAHILLTLLPALPFLAAVPSLREKGRRAELARFALVALFLPLLAVYVISFRTPLWLPRYFVFLTPMLGLLLARGLWSMRPPLVSAIWTGLLLGASAYACVRYAIEYTKEPWREAVARIAIESPPGRTAALVPFDLDPFRYYNRRQPRPVSAFEVSHPRVPFASDYTPQQLDELEEMARKRVAGYDEVWVVVRSPNSDIRREVARRGERAAADGRELVAREVWTSMTGPLRLARYRRAETAADSSAVR